MLNETHQNLLTKQHDESINFDPDMHAIDVRVDDSND